MYRLFIPNIVGNGVLWILGAALTLGGWYNQSIAYTLLAIAAIWSAASVIYHRNKHNQVTGTLKEWLNSQNRKQKWVLFGVKIGVSIVFISALLIYANIILYNTINHPSLAFTYPQISITNDADKQIDTCNITFVIENTGTSAAYQMHTRIFCQPSTLQLTKLVNTKPYDVSGTNPLQPKEKYSFPFFMQLPYDLNKSDEKLVESFRWYIYIQQEYGNSVNSSKWRLHTDKYWWVFDFKTKDLEALSPDEINLFQKALNIEGY
jgi:hypothetical protein